MLRARNTQTTFDAPSGCLVPFDTQAFRKLCGHLLRKQLMRSRAVPRFENHLTNRAASVLGTGDGGSTQLLLLNGGFAAWDDADLPIADHPRSPDRCIYAASLGPST